MIIDIKNIKRYDKTTIDKSLFNNCFIAHSKSVKILYYRHTTKEETQ